MSVTTVTALSKNYCFAMTAPSSPVSQEGAMAIPVTSIGGPGALHEAVRIATCITPSNARGEALYYLVFLQWGHAE
jgi:hypothetical protein